MIASTMLRLKILKTKKRLSDDFWTIKIVEILFLGLFVILSFAIRTTFISSAYGLIESEIPAVSLNFEDPDDSSYKEVPRSTLDGLTPIVVLTDKEFFIGDINAFSTEISEVRNKFFVKHLDGAPNITELSETLKKWLFTRNPNQDSVTDGIIILLPDKNIPMPIVIQTMSALKNMPYFKQVVLASGMI